MDNYYDTAQRMYKSSEILHKNQDYHNACYLAGYVVECYAKIIVGVTYKFNYTEIAKEFSHNLKDLNRELKYILIHSNLTEYIVDMKIDFCTILSGNSKWNPIKRYSENGEIWDLKNSSGFQNEITLAMQKLVKMKIDGHNLI